MTALAKVTDDIPSLESPDDSAAATGDVTNDDYYTLSQEEMEALINGDMSKIESWVSNLDRRHAIWLLRWLIKETQ